MVWGAYRPHAHLSRQNLVNATLCLIALWPSIAATYWLFTNCPHHSINGSFEDTACHIAMDWPVLMVNLLYFFNVSVGFWIVGLLQRNFWLIDPYWTLLPPLIDLFYIMHPRAHAGDLRSAIADFLLLVWAVRLTWNYFRREEWKFGQREDWRYTKMAEENPKTWWLLSFFAVGIAQQPLLCLFTVPLYSVHFHAAPWCIWDTAAFAACLLGLLIAHLADNHLWEYMHTNEQRVAQGLPRLPLLQSGIWQYSRHPNYFGEQLWWWGLAILSVHLGDWWGLAGTFINSIVLAVVTVMTEERMIKNWSADRVKLYREYQQTTSVWVPLPKWGKKKDF